MNKNIALKLLALFLVIIAELNLSNAQKISGMWENAQILQTKKGFLVYGLSKKDKKIAFNVKFYDKDLNLVTEVSKAVVKGGGRLDRVVEMDGKVEFGMKLSSLVVTDDLSESQYYQWSKADIKAAREAYKSSSMDDYMPVYVSDMMRGRSNGIYRGDTYLELVHKNKLPLNVMGPGVRKNDYKGGPAIRGFSLNDRTNYQTYKNKWSVALGEFKISCFKWFPLNNESLFLYISEFNKVKGSEFIYKVDASKGNVDFRVGLTLKDTSLAPVFSTMAMDDSGHLIVVGNYFKKVRPKRERGMRMEGWFIIKIDAAGEQIAEVIHEFDPPVLPASFDDDKLERRCMSFQILQTTQGSIILVGENIRLHFSKGSYSPNMSHPGTPAANSATIPQRTDYYQTYGVSFLKLDNKLEIIDNNYFETIYTTRDREHGKTFALKSTMYEQNIYELLADLDLQQVRNPLYEYITQDFSAAENGNRLVYRQYEKDIDEYTYTSIYLSGDSAGQKKVVETNLDKQDIKFFTKSPTELYKFKTSKTRFSLEVIPF
ncbi:MAG TPA: hypothetical protein EYN71_03710 [Flavobacteriales bacterium]|nr:hypothetical protein [Flavobacteriales bacterium]